MYCFMTLLVYRFQYLLKIRPMNLHRLAKTGLRNSAAVGLSGNKFQFQ